MSVASGPSYRTPAQLLKEGAGRFGEEVGCRYAVICEELFRLTNQARSDLFAAVPGQDKKTGEPGIQVFVPGEIVEDNADHAQQLILFDGNKGKRQRAVGSLRFEFAQRNRAIPAGIEMLPLLTAEFCKTECDNRMIFEIVDFHWPRLVKIAASILWNPLFFGDTTQEIFVSGEDEEEIGQPIQKSHSILADLFAL
jgi:hypothetical protein